MYKNGKIELIFLYAKLYYYFAFIKVVKSFNGDKMGDIDKKSEDATEKDSNSGVENETNVDKSGKKDDFRDSFIKKIKKIFSKKDNKIEEENIKIASNGLTSNSIEVSTLGVKNLVKKFGAKTAVNNATFSMKQGEIVGLLGPNGAGKTTIFYMIVGFIKPTNGDIFLNRHKITKLQMFKRSHLGICYLSQESSIFRKLTVEQNIDAVLENINLSKAEKKRRKEQAIEDLGIGRLVKQQAYSLSGGEKRRTEIARALVLNPKFLLLDEPFAGVDPIAVADIQGIIGGLKDKNIGVLITDHNVRETLQITDRAYIINLGNIFRSGNADELVNDPMVRKLYLGENFSF